MPRVGHVDGLKFNVHPKDHAPSHVHVWEAEFEVLLVIRDGSVYQGNIPSLAKAQAWLAANRDMLIDRWNTSNPQNKYRP